MPRSKKKAPSASPSYPRLLYPYWRYRYTKKVLENKSPHDPFLDLKKSNDKKRLIVVRGAWGCLFLNTSPYAPGHLLAAPYRAVGEIESLTDDEREELMDLVIVGKILLKKVLNADGFNIGLNQGEGHVSGGSVPTHLHWHIVPRWRGDSNFMPVVGGTRLLILSQQAVWRALVKAYQKKG